MYILSSLFVTHHNAFQPAIWSFWKTIFTGFRHFGRLTLKADSLFRHTCGFSVFEEAASRRQGAGRRSPQRRPQFRLADLHGLVRRWTSAPPSRCSSATTHPHGHQRGSAMPALVLLPRPRHFPLSDARGRVRGGGPPPPSAPHVHSVTPA